MFQHNRYIRFEGVCETDKQKYTHTITIKKDRYMETEMLPCFGECIAGILLLHTSVNLQVLYRYLLISIYKLNICGRKSEYVIFTNKRQ